MKTQSKLLKVTALSAAVLPSGLACDAATDLADPSKKQPAADTRPNIVVVIADDLLTTELSCYGGQNISTPNIDRLAAEGVQFSNNFASVAMSVPIRASMYTGLYPVRHGSYRNHKGSYPETRTVNEYMPELGYRVGRTGKDHPGPKTVYKFDEIPGFTVGCTNRKAPFSTDGIKEWIRKDDKPFLLYVCSIHPHAPWTWGDPSEFDPDKFVMPENCVDSPEMRQILAKYLAEVRALDNEVGAVREALEETGELDNTIFIFLGEQGPQFPGGKWTLWYPGCHSALIARYPEKIKPGSKCDALVQYEDLLPTFIDIAGGKPREELDGISFKKALFGKKTKTRKYVYGIHNNVPEGKPYPIRSIRDERYALIMNLTPEEQYHEKHLMNAQSDTGVWQVWEKAAEMNEENAFWKDRYLTRPEFEFYDLKYDPWERTNQIDNPAFAKRIETMKAELFRWMEEQGDTGKALDSQSSVRP